MSSLSFAAFRSFVAQVFTTSTRYRTTSSARKFKRVLVTLMMLGLLFNQVLASPLFIQSWIDTGAAWKQEVLFRWHAGNWAMAWQKGQPAAVPQETQSDRDARVVRIEVSPEKAEMQTGDTIIFSATAYGTGHDTISGVQFTWTLTHETYKREMRMPPDGKFTPYVAGKYRIVASALGRKGETSVTVTGDDLNKKDSRPIGEPFIFSTKDDMPVTEQ